MNMMCSALMTLALITSGAVCAFLAPLGSVELHAAEQAPSPPRLNVSEAVANRDKWNNKVVEISGYYFSGPEVSAIYQNAEQASAAEDKKGLWIAWNVKAGHRDKVKWINRGQVRIVGRFEKKTNGSGHLGRWAGQITELELMEAISAAEGDKP